MDPEEAKVLTFLIELPSDLNPYTAIVHLFKSWLQVSGGICWIWSVFDRIRCVRTKLITSREGSDF